MNVDKKLEMEKEPIVDEDTLLDWIIKKTVWEVI